MVDAIVSPLLEQLISISYEEAKQQVRLVTGVGKQVKKLTSNLRAIQAVLNDAEQRQVKEESVRLWLDQLKEASYDMEDVLDEWITARLKLQIEGVDENALVHKKPVCSFFLSPCIGFKQVALRRDIAQKIIEITENLDDIAKQKDVFNFNVIRGSTEKSDERIHSTALINVSDVRGRDEEKNTLKSKLLCESNEEQNAVQIISLVGMGGIGKTTLAQFAYNDKDVIRNFDKRIWVCVSDHFDEFRIAKAIIEGLEGSLPNLGELNSLLEYIYASITGKKFFLVLDDVWTDDYSKWEPFHNCLMNGLCGSRILVTTRKETVARMMESTDVISIKGLSEEECWSLFKRFAFFDRSPTECEQLEEIGRKIVGKCKGLPLAAKTIGSLLRFKRTREEWKIILNSEMWQLGEFDKGLLAPLLLSYNDLPPVIKRCFLYCAVFPKDYNIEKDELVKLWMAQGYIEQKGNIEMEMIGEGYFDYLATRSFFQDFNEYKEGYFDYFTCKMHDIVHDFAQYLTRKEFVAIEVDGDEKPLSLTNTCQEKLRHLTLMLGVRAKFPVSIFDAKKLHSLILFYSSEDQLAASPVLQGLFDQLTCLRALKIQDPWHADLTIKIPKGLENLIHLRYLKLSAVEELPETCCELLNLQTLDCLRLRRLPQGIGKLINLRHLIFDVGNLAYVPDGIERLTSLRTLSEFAVARVGGKYSSKSCNLDGLRHLNHLRGFLQIDGLGNVRDADEAKNAHLEKKKNLIDLILIFNEREESDDEEASEEMNEEKEGKHEAVCEALRPPPDIESLQIMLFKGRTSSNWIGSLNKLKMLTLNGFLKCEIMPPLGKLPSLEILRIGSMESVKRVGDEFLGMEISDHIPIHGTSSSSPVIAFPKLQILELRHLDELEEWDLGNEDITIMPQIKSLYIAYCKKLKSLPELLLRSTTLESLTILAVPIVQESFKKGTEKDWSKISHIPNIKI